MPQDVTLRGSGFTSPGAAPQVDGTAATFKGTPTDAQAVVTVPTTSPKTVAITVKNDAGESSEKSFEITAPAQAPTLDSISPETAEAG